MTYYLAISIVAAVGAMLAWRNQKRREYATVVDRRLLAISARAQSDNPHFESYR